MVSVSRSSSHGHSDFGRTSLLGVLASGALAGLMIAVIFHLNPFVF